MIQKKEPSFESNACETIGDDTRSHKDGCPCSPTASASFASSDGSWPYYRRDNRQGQVWLGEKASSSRHHSLRGCTICPPRSNHYNPPHDGTQLFAAGSCSSPD